ncbi:MAG TPA: DUF2846 domain-containing protein [Tepidisphaeraceae bacterium]|nr:DUF2846 domain-containing protein [Tepidisphaeraceae bacterium]
MIALRFGRQIGIAGLLALLCGCATVATTSSAQNADARKFQPAPGTASVYLCRSSAVIGDTLVAEMQLDGESIGALAPNTYLMLSVTPGHHVLTVTGPTNSEQAALDAVAGNNYFFNVSFSWDGPLIRHRHIGPMSDADGRNAVNSENRAAGTVSGS